MRKPIWIWGKQISKSAFSTVTDIVKAMKSSDFFKGLGPDMFDGRLLLYESILENYMMLFDRAPNKSEIPDYLKEARLIKLFKTGRAETELDHIPPIAITSHLFKVIE